MRVGAIEFVPGKVETAPGVEEYEVLDFIPIEPFTDETIDVIPVEPGMPDEETEYGGFVPGIPTPEDFLPEPEPMPPPAPIPAPTPLPVPVPAPTPAPTPMPAPVPIEVVPITPLPIMPPPIAPPVVLPLPEEVPQIEFPPQADKLSTRPPGQIDKNALLACVVVCCLCRRW